MKLAALTTALLVATAGIAAAQSAPAPTPPATADTLKPAIAPAGDKADCAWKRRQLNS